jgi:glutathione S-transferase
VDHTGGALPDPGIVAVPYVQINGVYISQTMAIMEALGDELGYLPPQKVQAKARQCLLNIYDIADQGFVKRKEIKTKAQAAEFVNSRVKQFFVAIEAGYKEFAGSLFYGENTFSWFLVSSVSNRSSEMPWFKKCWKGPHLVH